jgi:ribosomal protein S16
MAVSSECLRYVYGRLHADGGTIEEALASYKGKWGEEETTAEEVQVKLEVLEKSIASGSKPAKAVHAAAARPNLKVSKKPKKAEAKKPKKAKK